jgi:hypothetical protein
MRFLMLVKATEESEAGALPTREVVEEMSRYNEELLRAGVLLVAEGLHPSSRGKRISFSAGRRTVIDGPFAETKELIAGFWMIQVKSREEAMEWASRIPFTEGVVEVREVFEATDFPPEIVPPEAAEREQAMRDQLQRREQR